MKQIVIGVLYAVEAVLVAKIAYDLYRLVAGLWRMWHGREPE